MMRVLLIEDDPEMTRAFSLMAKSHDFLCRPTASGKEGLALSRAGKFDIIVLALQLPDLDGLKVLREIRAARIDTPVLILSSRPVRDEAVASGALGVCECLTKPVSKRQLLDRMQELTGREEDTTTPNAERSQEATARPGEGVIPTSQPSEVPGWMKSVAGQLPPNQGPESRSSDSDEPAARAPEPKEAKSSSSKPSWLKAALSHFSPGKQTASKPEPTIGQNQESAGGMPSWLRAATEEPASETQSPAPQRRSGGPPAWLGPRSAETSGAHVPRETLPEREPGAEAEPRMTASKATPPAWPEPQISQDPARQQAPTPQDSARAAIEKVLAETLGEQTEADDGAKVLLPDSEPGKDAPAEPRIVADRKEGAEKEEPEVSGPEIDWPEIDWPEIGGSEKDGPEKDGRAEKQSAEGQSEHDETEVIRPDIVAPEESPAIEGTAAEHPVVERPSERPDTESLPMEVIEPEIVAATEPEAAQETVAEDQTDGHVERFSAEEPFTPTSFVFDKPADLQQTQSSASVPPQSAIPTPQVESPSAETPSVETPQADPAPASSAPAEEAKASKAEEALVDGAGGGALAAVARPSRAPDTPSAATIPRQQSARDARVIVLGNEKGGTGKSTTAMHLIVSLLYDGRTVGSIDIDARQGTLTRYIENRNVYAAKHGLDLPSPDHHSVMMGENALRSFEAILHRLSETCDDIVVDAGGSDSALSRLAHAWADTLITPINDSFLDLDVLAQFDPDTLQVRRPSHYATMVWQARRRKAARGEGEIDWVVVRNRLTNLDSHNKRKVSEAVHGLAEQFGFRSGLGFTERMIYRQLFLDGLTLLDLRDEQAGIKLSLAHVAARQELRNLMQAISPKQEAATDTEDAAGNAAAGSHNPAAAQRSA